MLTPAEFWNARILRWEDARYKKQKSWMPWNWSILRRRRLTQNLVQAMALSNDKILDLGCGSGYFVDGFHLGRDQKYHGVDISASAIEAARLKWHGENFVFTAADIQDLSEVEGDIVVALGLLDWLEPTILFDLLDRSQWKKAIVSYTAESNSIKNKAYRFYRQSFGKTQIKPQSYRHDDLGDAMKNRSFLATDEICDVWLSPGRLLILEKQPREKNN